jgi:hypothetical protein
MRGSHTDFKELAWRVRFASFALCAVFSMLGAVACDGGEPSGVVSPDARYRVGNRLFEDDFTHGLGQWTAELEKGGIVQARDGTLAIDVPAGCTCWFKERIEGPVLIQYEATAISAGGANDRVSDLNCFWMARDPRAAGDILDIHRQGSFAEYNLLTTYYVGLGGNGNTTTRFRRYIGDANQRPLLPEHDLRDKKYLLAPNVSQTLRLVACGPLVQFYRDGDRLFEMNDASPYTNGWFALRTVSSHLEIRNFRVFRLVPEDR